LRHRAASIKDSLGVLLKPESCPNFAQLTGLHQKRVHAPCCAKRHRGREQLRIFRIPQLNVVKVSFLRPMPQGSLHDRDIHAGQHHVPLANTVVQASNSYAG
jgi:hypothetical protein